MVSHTSGVTDGPNRQAIPIDGSRATLASRQEAIRTRQLTG